MEMLRALDIPLLPSGLILKISATVGVLILALSLTFFRYQWKMITAFRSFPSKRFDVEWTLKILSGKFPKNVPRTNVIFQSLLKGMNEFREQGLCVMWFFRPHVFVFSEEYMKNLAYESSLADKSSSMEINNLIFGNGLIGSKHDVWKVHRKLLNPAFNMGILKSKMVNFNRYAFQLVEKLETMVDKPVDDVWEVLKYCTFQNMADFVLGLKLNDESHLFSAEKFVKSVDIMTEQFAERVSRPWIHWNALLPFFPSGRKYLKMLDLANKQVQVIQDELIKKYVASEKEQLNDDSQVVNSCGDILMRLYHQHPDFTEKDLRDHLATFVSAGYDTISVSMLWCFYTLGRHPEVQERAYNELQSVVPEGDVTYEHLVKLKYLECVIKETQRLYPTVPMVGRRASRDIQCGKYTIPKGAEVTFFIFMLHRDPNIFPEPEKFDPERFANASHLRPWMYIPFAEGYRNCIGKRFALMEMKIQLAHVLRRFRITSVNKIDESDLEWAVVMKPMKPFRFLFENRHSKS